MSINEQNAANEIPGGGGEQYLQRLIYKDYEFYGTSCTR